MQHSNSTSPLIQVVSEGRLGNQPIDISEEKRMTKTTAAHPAPTPYAAQPTPEVRSAFTRVLAGWAGDVLRLKAARLDVPSARPGSPMGAASTRREARS